MKTRLLQIQPYRRLSYLSFRILYMISLLLALRFSWGDAVARWTARARRGGARGGEPPLGWSRGKGPACAELEGAVVSMGTDEQHGLGVDDASAPDATAAAPSASHIASKLEEIAATASHVALGQEPSAESKRRETKASFVARSLATSSLLSIVDPTLVHDVAAVVICWATRWKDSKALRSLIDMPSLLHEVEESTVAIHLLLQSLLSSEHLHEDRVCVVDLCAGKGIMSMLLSFLAARRPLVLQKIRGILLVERSGPEQINWQHIIEVNSDVARREDAHGEAVDSHLLAAVPIELYSGCNIHDPEIETRLRETAGQLAIVGIHLCRTLSARCVGLYNMLGHAKAPVLLLAPCCLPRTSGRPIPVSIFEPAAARAERLRALQRRANTARSRRACWICGSEEHRHDACDRYAAAASQLSSNETKPADDQHTDRDADPVADHTVKLETSAGNFASLAPCWRCGEVGHQKRNCTSAQASNRPPLLHGPTCMLDVASVRQAADPFAAWCEALAAAVEAPSGDTSLRLLPLHAVECAGSDERNWNRHRKCSWITCCRAA